MSSTPRLPPAEDGGKPTNSDNVKVSVRMRPMNRRETANGDNVAWDWTSRSVQLRDSDAAIAASVATAPGDAAASPRKRAPAAGPPDSSRSSFTFDYVFQPEDDNDVVYRDIGEHVVEGAVNGYHSSIFAYGQTSTGKTHTMLGSGSRITGILGNAVQGVFRRIRETPNREFLLRVSFMEIYNEAVNDLLVPTSTNLVIFEHSKKGCVVRGLLEEVVTSEDRILELVASGLRHRKVGSTNYNATSSRSHTIFRMIIESKPKGASEVRVV
jgi:centromeric protein E